MERKTIFTFLAQGAVGGAVGYFLFGAYSAISNPSGYSFFYLFFVPVFIVCGAVLGSVTAIFVWLPGALLKERLGFVTRAAIATASMMLLIFALSRLTREPGLEPSSLSWVIGFSFVISLPLVLMTGTSIRPCRMIVMGVGPRPTRHNLGSWVSYPVGFLLRAASIFGLLEALMTLALWIAARRSEWFTSPGRELLPEIVLAVLYFAAGTYISFRSPRKLFLLPTAILLNLLPLAFLMVNLPRAGTSDWQLLIYACLVFISLWAIYTLGRMIAPESVLGARNSASGMAHVRKVPQSGDCLVQL